MSFADAFAPKQTAKMLILSPIGETVCDASGKESYLMLHPEAGPVGEKWSRDNPSKKGAPDLGYDMNRLKVAQYYAAFIDNDMYLVDPSTGEDVTPPEITNKFKVDMLKPLHMNFLVEQIQAFIKDPVNFQKPGVLTKET